MQKRFDLLTQQLFQKNITDCSVEELQNLADQYPYFAPAQYALLKKLQQTESPDYKKQLQKAILYYHNPPLFEQFINEEVYEFDLDEALLPSNTVEKLTTPENLEPETETALPTAEENANEIVSEQFSEVKTGDVFEEPEVIIEEQDNDDAEEKLIEETAPLKVALPSLTEPAKEAGKSLAFEPYHTVDYFASQGIKLSQEEATKDRFGRQLKSFTEWLKAMKKVPAPEQLKPIDAVSEQNVENLAAHSVDKAEIVTEAMAEVWLKQGNNEKAIEIYNKLSLLNPSKRAYFAAKVDFLKKEI